MGEIVVGFRGVPTTEVASVLESALRGSGTSARAAGSKAYLKSDLEFFGATVGDIRATVKRVESGLGHEDLVDLASRMWERPVFEMRLGAALLLERHVGVLDASDLPFVERLLRESRTWALVDVLAGNVVGEISLRHEVEAELDRWAIDDDFWVRRSSLLAELRPLKAGRPLGPFGRRADAMLEEKEFFIRKAIGWVLRDTSKTRPDEIYDWIAPRAHRASGVTMREAVKYLDTSRRERLMRAYKERRPIT